MTITSDEKIGIGTTIPQKLLDITDSSSGESIPLVISNRDTTSGTGQKVTLGFGLARDGGALKPEAGTIEVGREAAWNTDATVDSYMAFSTYLNNSATEKLRITSSGNVGIGTDSPDSSLEIYKSSTAELMIGSDNGGTAQISLYESNSTTKEATIKYDGLANNLVIGTSGEANAIVIPRDTGYVTMPAQPAFAVHKSSDQTLNVGSATIQDWGTEIFDVGSNFASNTSTAPVSGKYFFQAQARVDDINTSSSYYIISINTSNRNSLEIIDPNFTGTLTYLSRSVSGVFDMDAGDTAQVNVQQYSGSASHVEDSISYTNFSGYLLG